MRAFGLIGYPLGHSASARYFGDKFAREGITDATYQLYQLPDIKALPELLSTTPTLCGFNVTIPYKQQILPYLQALSPEAECIGAVNCVRCEGGALVGYNTDVVGVRIALQELLAGVMPARALVLGTGGASQAVQYVLAEMGIDFALVSRDAAKGNFTYNNLPCEEVAACQLIVNASPVGTFPQVDAAPQIPYAFLSPKHYLFDLVYNPPLTQFLAYGRQRNAHILNGERMFAAQAEAAWKIWNTPLTPHNPE